MTNPTVYDRLQTDVVRPGLCTGCGTCVALSNGQLTMRETVDGPQPQAVTRNPDLPQAAYDACPGKGLPYPALNKFVFGRQPENWLIGCYKSLYIGYAAEDAIRRNGASGGVITRTLAWLLEQGEIDAAIVAKMGGARPFDVSGELVTTPEEVYAAAQSIYRPVPVNAALAQLDDFDGRVAYVGLPDQVAALRQMQRLNVPAAQKITLVLGPYTGTNMTFEAVRSYLRTQGVTDDSQIADLRYREGEWPGNLYIRLTDGREFRVAKFYYNYLIPFYITRTTLFSVDFANELTDISVGDAWNPKYEDAGQGFSVVVARTERGDDVLNRMAADGTLELDPTTEPDALAMHGHMIDFKKRGSFIRMTWRRAAGRAVPEYGYRPAEIPLSRYAVEAVISGVFRVCSLPPMRWLAEQIPLDILGPAFNTARKRWKALSKPTKRAGLGKTDFVTEPAERIGVDLPFTPVPDEAPLPDKIAAEVRHWLRRDWTLQDVGRHWDATEHYDDINAETHSYFRRFTDGLRIAGDYLKDDAKVLDITCRTGNGTLYFWEHGKVGESVCVDPSPRMREALKQHVAASDFPPDKYRWVQMTEERLPLPNETFETVLCFETLEHLADPETFVGELARVTKPGGVAVITTPNLLWEPVHALAAVTGLHHSEGPHRFLRRRDLRRMVLNSGFDLLEEETTVLIPSGPQWLVEVGNWIERHTRKTLMPHLGLRRILVCRRR